MTVAEKTTKQQYADQAAKMLLKVGGPYDAGVIHILANQLESNAILLKACQDVVSWYENAGNADPDDSVTAWRMCRDAIKQAVY